MNRLLAPPRDRLGDRQRPSRQALDEQLARVRADIVARFQPMIDGLAPVQRNVLELMAHGLRPDEVAERLGIQNTDVPKTGIIDGLYLGRSRSDQAIAIAAWWVCRAARTAPICDADEHCGCADILEGTDG